MTCHSEDIWNSFDALGRRIQQLSHIIRQMEARIEALEQGQCDRLDDLPVEAAPSAQLVCRLQERLSRRVLS